MLCVPWCWLFVVDVTDSPNNSTTNTTISDDVGEDSGLSFLTKSVISLVGLGICIVIALTVGRVVDRCHDVLAVRDDRSDMSEKTRDLLKIKNAATFIFRANRKSRNANVKVRSFEAATKWGRVWLVKVTYILLQSKTFVPPGLIGDSSAFTGETEKNSDSNHWQSVPLNRQ